MCTRQEPAEQGQKEQGGRHMKTVQPWMLTQQLGVFFHCLLHAYKKIFLFTLFFFPLMLYKQLEPHDCLQQV